MLQKGKKEIRDYSYQDDSETEKPSFAVYKKNTVFIPRIYVEVVVHAKSTHMFKGVFFQLHFIHICRGDERCNRLA